MSMASVALSPVYQDYWNFPGRIFAQNAPPWSDDSILIYLTVGGSVIPLRVLESDSIASVKLRVQKCKGFFARKQKLVFGGKELAHNSSRVRDYGVVDGNILHLVLRLSDLQAISVHTVCGKEFEFHVQRKENVGYVKQQIASKAKGLLLNGQELYCDDEELEDQRIIDDICKSNDAVIHLLVRKSAKLRAIPVEKDFEVSIVASGVEEKIVEIGETTKLSTRTLSPMSADFSLEPLTTSSNIVLSSLIRTLIDATFDGLERGYKPIRSAEGSGGAYFMQDSSGKNWVSVFKPIDEEPMAVNNPRGLPVSSDGEGLKKGTRVGEGALREVAAYILDHPRGGPRSVYSDEKGFAGVPPTVMVKCRHRGFNYGGGFEYMPEKLGSLQMYVKNSGSCEDMGPRDFPVEEVHKICVLDLRLANADRHGGNILIHKDGEKDQFVLTPIDHGYCLPESVSILFCFLSEYSYIHWLIDL